MSDKSTSEETTVEGLEHYLRLIQFEDSPFNEALSSFHRATDGLYEEEAKRLFNLVWPNKELAELNELLLKRNSQEQKES